MSISTEQAIKMIDEKMAREAENSKPEEQTTDVKDTSTPEPEKPTEPEPEQPKDDTPKDETPEKKPAEEKPEEQPKDKPEEDDKKSDKKLPPSKKYTKEQRTAHSFAIEKQKRKAAQARVKELEAELSKYKGLKPEDFGNDVEAYTTYRLDEQHKLDEVERTKRYIRQSEESEMEAETERKIHMCFPDEVEREEYRELIAARGEEFVKALEKHDPEGMVLGYLKGVEEFPIVLRELMTNPKSLGYVFRDKDPYELRHNLHVFTKELLSGKKPVEAEPEHTKQPSELKPLPVIGKQVTATAKPSEPVHDRAYWNDYLRKHPNG